MIVDFHVHILPSWLRAQRERFLERDATFRTLYSDPRYRIATAQDALEAMDEDGVAVSVVMGVGWRDQGLAREVNDYIVEAVRTSHDRLVGFCGVNPGWGEAAALEAERCARAGLRGIGELHPDTQGFDLGAKATMASLMEVAKQYSMVLLTHSSEPVGHLYQGKGRTTPDVLFSLAESFPDNVIVCAHWGGGLPFYALMPEVAGALRNVYFDTAASPFLYTPQVFPTVAGLVGASRVLLGSDFPLLRPRHLIRQAEEAPLSQDDKAAILGGNAARLLGLAVPSRREDAE